MPADHVSRSPNDTYYIDADTVLRCHTSAHQAATLRQGQSAFLITGAGTQGARPASARRAPPCQSLSMAFLSWGGSEARLSGGSAAVEQA